MTKTSEIPGFYKLDVKNRIEQISKFVDLDENDLIRVAINLSYTYDNEKIQPDDEIALFPPVSGG